MISFDAPPLVVPFDEDAPRAESFAEYAEAVAAQGPSDMRIDAAADDCPYRSPELEIHYGVGVALQAAYQAGRRDEWIERYDEFESLRAEVRELRKTLQFVERDRDYFEDETTKALATIRVLSLQASS